MIYNQPKKNEFELFKKKALTGGFIVLINFTLFAETVEFFLA